MNKNSVEILFNSKIFYGKQKLDITQELIEIVNKNIN